MIKSFSTENTVATSTYENTTYGIQIKYPSDWSVQESRPSGELINIAAFLSPTGNPFPTAEVTVYMDRLHNSTTNSNNYAHFVAFTDYENRPSYFHAFKLVELSTNSSLAGKLAYTIIGTYDLPSSGLQKIMEIGTIIGDKAYSLQYIADAPKFSGYLPAVQKMIDSLQITSQLVPIPSPAPGREIVIGPNGTATIRGFNGTWATFRGPPGSILHNFRIVPEPNNTSK